jgi:hypothetical protein
MFSSFMKRKSASEESSSPPQPEPPKSPDRDAASPLHSDPNRSNTTAIGPDTHDTQLTDTVPTTDSIESLSAANTNHHVTFHESTGAESYEDEELEYTLSFKLSKDRYLGSLGVDQKFERLMELVEELHVNSVQNIMIQEEMVAQMEQRVAAKLAANKADVLAKLEEARQLALLDDGEEEQ